MDFLLKTTITAEGYAASVNNVPNSNGFRIEITKIQAVVKGVPKAMVDAKGVAIGGQQIRVRATLTSASEEYSFDELWLYDGLSNQVFAKIKRADNGVIDHLSPYKRSIINYTVSFVTLPDGSVTIQADDGQSAALAELDVHKNDPEAHKELLDYLAGISIYHYTTIPTIKKGEIIYAEPFGLMKWNERWGLYRSIDSGKKEAGWALTPAAGYMLGNGSLYSKSGNYKGLWTAVQDNGTVVPAKDWVIGTYLFADVDADTFRAPDIRGHFDRNASMGSGIDAGRNIFSGQSDAMQRITGSFQSRRFIDVVGCVFPTPGANLLFQMTQQNGVIYNNVGSGPSQVKTDTMYFDNSFTVRTADENRPRNTAYPAWIKF